MHLLSYFLTSCLCLFLYIFYCYRLKMITTALLKIVRVRVTVVGDKDSGKTSLIQSFKHEKFHSIPMEGDMCTKMHYVDDVRYLFTLVELHNNWVEMAHKTEGSDVVIVCFDESNFEKIERVKTTWIPDIRLHLPKAKIFVVRTKSDIVPRYDNLEVDEYHSPEEIAKQLKLQSGLECSAKDMNGINFVFLEILRHLNYLSNNLRPKEVKPPVKVEGQDDICSIPQRVSSSIPLIKQAGHNIRELAMNPDCFPAIKEKIHWYVPFLFRSRPTYDYRRLEEENKAKEDEMEKIRRDSEDSHEEDSDDHSE